MKRPDPNVVDATLRIRKQSPEFYLWLKDWYYSELERLPSAGQNVALSQGRCQVLKELYELFDKSPDIAAQSRRIAADHAHQ
jgi:hypothetical protein